MEAPRASGSGRRCRAEAPAGRRARQAWAAAPGDAADPPRRNAQTPVAPEQPRLAGEKEPLVVARAAVHELQALVGAGTGHPEDRALHRPPSAVRAGAGQPGEAGLRRGAGLRREAGRRAGPGTAARDQGLAGMDDAPLPVLGHGVLVDLPEKVPLDHRLQGHRQGVAVLLLVALDGPRDLVPAKVQLLLAVVLHDVAPGGHGRAHDDEHDGDGAEKEDEGEAGLTGPLGPGTIHFAPWYRPRTFCTYRRVSA